jgi:hypothetical protein
MNRLFVVAIGSWLSLCAMTASAQPSGLRDLCAAQARDAGFQGAAARRFERRCLSSPMAAIVFSDPQCRKAAEATIVSERASSRLGNLSAAQRQSGEDCRIERTMLDVNDSMLALIDNSSSHCGHTPAGIELMRASQKAMKGMGC